MIPKQIHCIWLSGEPKPEIYNNCLLSWSKVMPDYEIKEWSLVNLPKEVLTHPFVASAVKERKWAFAADYIRLWALYTYGGIYLDMDVYVYKRFDPFLSHAAFGCIEFNPKNFYKYIRLKRTNFVRGLNIDAAMMGAEKKHNWIKPMMDFYENRTFVNSSKSYNAIIMPLVVSKISIDFGFRYIPIYQVLQGDVHIYPPDVFSSCYDWSLTKCDSYDLYGDNCVRYSAHLVAHSWYENENDCNIMYNIKKIIILLLGKKNVKWLKNKLYKKRNVVFNKL